ncbi:MAG: GNAT family N-acetyltransferase [Deltaproteobacteria bacterium]|nr:GNAT family N-acetyltransferase [Deltaproteobacteria bacterium]MBW2016570.1 GNAT family N-acetyltransferase [Deltaproteobacteria bacterium]MBW2129335.1 GNAT family N-acetyltransferase [Deltaproteobacteria bacterium]MBW2303296.1 GNAT family N-acetyltransferase [Deltaproteobacteria bacterium]
MKIRMCREEDVDAVRRFVERTRPLDLHSPFTYWVLLRYFPETCFIMEDGEKVVGFISGVTSSRERDLFYLWQIGIDPGLRGKGYAERLIHRILDAAREKGCRRLQVTIAPDNPASLKAFSRFASNSGLTMERVGAADFFDSISGKRYFEDIYEMRI